MALSRGKFRKLAKKLLGTTAGDFSGPITFIRKGTWDYDTQSSINVQFVFENCLVTSVEDSEVADNQDIQVGDKKIICEFSDTEEIRSDNTQCMIDGELHDIISSPSIGKVIYKIIVRKV